MNQPTKTLGFPDKSLTSEQSKTLGKITAKLSLLGLEAYPTTEVSSGPIVTAYRFVPKGRTKFSQLEKLGTDLAIYLGVDDVFVKRLPGESSVAFFVPNAERRTVDFKDTITSYWKLAATAKLPLNFGVDYLGEPFIEDLTTLPHLLVAGSTGSGKSTFMASLVTSLIYKFSANEVQLAMSDTKGVEFQRFDGLPHLTYGITTDVPSSLSMFNSVITTMEERLQLFNRRRVRNIHEYNSAKLQAAKMPYVIVLIDELADLLTDRTKEENPETGKRTGPTRGRMCEDKLAYIVQKARATGVYVIAGTQRPSVDVVTGTIKANFPARLAFKLPAGHDSRTVLQTEGAEHLLSPGDMLYMSPTRPGLLRLHAPFTHNEDIDAAVRMAKGV